MNSDKSHGKMKRNHCGTKRKRFQRGEITTEPVQAATYFLTNEPSYDSKAALYPELRFRTTPLTLVKSIEEMNDVQKQEVKGMGFGAILDLRIMDIPHKMAYWILRNFDPKSCEIKLQGGRSLHINENDVELVLGFPHGTNLIQRRVKTNSCTITDLWRTRFDKPNNRILASDVAKDMIEERDGGEWFRRQFLVLLTCSLIEKLGNGYVSPQTLNNFYDVENVHVFNWCEYVLRCLVDHTLSWQSNRDKEFTGPILFLILLYVDRVNVFNMNVERCVPTIQNWGHRKLFNRQALEIKSGGFGYGFPEGPPTANADANPLSGLISDQPASSSPLVPPMNDCETELRNLVKVCEAEMISPIDKNAPGPSKETSPHESKRKIAEKIMEKGKLITDLLDQVICLVTDAPPLVFEDIMFRRIVDAALLVGKPQSSSPEADKSDNNSQTYTQNDDDSWVCPEHMAAIIEIENAAMKRDAFKKKLDSEVPSSSLGLEECISDAWEALVHLASKYNEGTTDIHTEQMRTNEPDYPLTYEDEEVAAMNEFIDGHTHCRTRPAPMLGRKELAKKRVALAGNSQPRETGVNQEKASEAYTTSQSVSALQPKKMRVQSRAPLSMSFHPNQIIGAPSTGAQKGKESMKMFSAGGKKFATLSSLRDAKKGSCDDEA